MELEDDTGQIEANKPFFTISTAFSKILVVFCLVKDHHYAFKK
jgi:hypothetical protein